MKRILCLLIALVLLLLPAAGCGKRSALSPSDPVTLTMWHVYGEQADSPMNRLIAQFNATEGKDKGIVISVTNVTSTSKIGSQLLAAQAGEPGAAAMPDLFSAHTNTALALGPDKLVNFAEHFTQQQLDNFVPAFLADGTKEGRLVVFPVSKSTYALFINGSQFERFSRDCAVSYDMLSTWEGFFDVAGKYYTWSGGKPFCALDYLIRHAELDVISRTGNMRYSDSGWYLKEDEAFRAAWEVFARALVQGHIIVSDMYANTQVMTGETLSGIGSTAAIGYYNDTVTYPDNTNEPTNLAVLPLPRSQSEKQYMPQTGVGLCAYSTDARKAEAAAVFVRWFTEGERNLDFVVETGYMPVHNGAYDAIEGYSFPDEGTRSLYEAIRTMRRDYTPVVRPDFEGYYGKVDELYAWLRQNCPALRARYEQGEALDTLTEETWNYLVSLS